MSNVVGTANILEAVKNQKSVKSVIVTTDKVYQNYTIRKYFKEESVLGGMMYSGSKACCEILTNSYRKSFFSKLKCNIATKYALEIVLVEEIGQKIELLRTIAVFLQDKNLV